MLPGSSIFSSRHWFLPRTPTIFCDNVSATYLAVNPILHARTLHVEIDYHFTLFENALLALRVLFVPSVDQLADIFTKGLSSSRFRFLRDKLSLHLRPDQLAGGLLVDDFDPVVLGFVCWWGDSDRSDQCGPFDLTHQDVAVWELTSGSRSDQIWSDLTRFIYISSDLGGEDFSPFFFPLVPQERE